MASTIGDWWMLHDQNVRMALTALEEKGLVQVQAGVRGKPAYVVTKAGREALAEWRSGTEFVPAPVRDDMHLRLFYFDPSADRTGLRIALETSLHGLATQAVRLRHHLETLEVDGPLAKLRREVLHTQLAHIGAETELVQNALGVLDALDAEMAAPRRRGSGRRGG
jgi:DNA-binding PadR family transcriptional regulator